MREGDFRTVRQLVDEEEVADEGAQPCIGTIILDSAALDVELLMTLPHLPLYDAAFGDDKLFWRLASPYRQLPLPRGNSDLGRFVTLSSP